MVKMVACQSSEIAPGGMTSRDILGHTIVVANVDGMFYAMDGICSHESAMKGGRRIEIPAAK